MKTKNENVIPDDIVGSYFNFNVKMLQYSSLKVTLNTNEEIRKSKFVEKWPVVLTIALGISAAFLQVSLIVESMTHDEKYLAMQISSHMFSNLLCISKAMRMATTTTEIQTVIREIGLVWKKNPPHRNVSEKIFVDANKTLFLCKCFLSVVVCCVVSFGLPPIQDMLFQYFAREKNNHTYDYSLRVFIFKYPFPINDASTYFSVLFEEEYLLIASAIYWICCDTLFAQLTAHLSLQFEVLQYDVESLINGEIIDDHLRENLIVLVKRHKKLLSICELVEYIFSPIVLATVLLSGLNICVNVFELNETILQGKYADASLHASLFIITFLQIVFYCTFAEALTQQTSSLADTIYNCRWTEKNYKFRIYLQMLILRSQHPFYCTAYGFFPIGHKRLTMVINTAFSYYMMIQTTSS